MGNGMKDNIQMSFRIDTEMWKDISKMCIEEGVSKQEFIKSAIILWLEHKKKQLNKKPSHTD